MESVKQRGKRGSTEEPMGRHRPLPSPEPNAAWVNNNSSNSNAPLNEDEYVRQRLRDAGFKTKKNSNANTAQEGIPTKTLCPILNASGVEDVYSHGVTEGRQFEGNWVTFLFKHLYDAELLCEDQPSDFKGLAGFHVFTLKDAPENVFVASKIRKDNTPAECTALMGQLCDAVNARGELSPLAVKVALLAGVTCWGTEDEETLSSILSTRYDMDDGYTGVLSAHIASSSFKFYYEDLSSYFGEELKPQTLLKPLQQELFNPRIIEALRKKYKYVSQKHYLPLNDTLEGDWKAFSLPEYWMVSPDCMLHLTREGRKFWMLSVTDTVSAVKNCDSGEQLAILGGESGSGKTCALFAAGGKDALHIVATVSEMLLEFKQFAGNTSTTALDEAMVKHVRKYVCSVARDALLMTSGNTTHPLSVVLHLDEAGVLYQDGGVEDLDKISKIRSLIRIHASLLNVDTQNRSGPEPSGEDEVEVEMTARKLQNEQLVAGEQPKYPEDALSPERRLESAGNVMRIRVVLAGTGLEELHSGATGSITGKYALITARPPSGVTLSNFVEAHFPQRGVAKALCAQPQFRHIVATNNRLLSLTLLRLTRMLKPMVEEMKVRKESTVQPGVVLPNIARAALCLLPTACVEAATKFKEANGLNGLDGVERQLLLRGAHVAYLKRVVIVVGPENTYNDVEPALTNAGFTPLHYNDREKEQRSPQVTSLMSAAALGIYSTTKKEVKSGTDKSNCVLAGCPTTEGDVVMVPKDKAPLIMSGGYRVFPRLLNKTLFGDGGPQRFEEVMTALLLEGLNALGLVDGGCDYRTLLAAVCGAEYGLPAENKEKLQGNTNQIKADEAHKKVMKATPPWQNPPFERLHFSRAILVMLPFRLCLTKKRRVPALRRMLVLACAQQLAKELEEQLESQRMVYLSATRDVDKLAACLKQLRGAIAATENSKNKKSATELQGLERLIAGVMFVVVPAPQSPSADTVLLCIGTHGEIGYLGALQWKCLVKTVLTLKTVNLELAKMGLPQLPVGDQQKGDQQEADDDDDDEEDAPEGASDVRAMMESVATGTGPAVVLSDAFFGVLKRESINGRSCTIVGNHRLHYYVREDAEFPDAA